MPLPFSRFATEYTVSLVFITFGTRTNADERGFFSLICEICVYLCPLNTKKIYETVY